MTERQRESLNCFFVSAFNKILMWEEQCLSAGECEGLSVKELHILEAAAALEGRLNVSCADVRRFAPEVLRHRIACNFHAVGENLTSDMIVEQLIGYVPESAE